MIVNLKDTFNNVVTMYDAARPTYPLELLNDIKDFAEKSFFTRGLEIGAGTGQATAFHWVDATVGYPKVWDMLNDSGVLAVFWHMSSVTLHDTGIFVGLNEIKKKYLPEESLGFDKEGIEGVRQKRISQIQSGNYFGIPVIKEYRWIDTYDADRYSLLLESYSSTQTLDEEHKKLYLSEVRDYINSNGGVVEMPQHVMLYLAKKSNGQIPRL